MPKKNKKHCPCGSGQEYNQCCGRYLEAGENPQTPEQLMRSRYSAYTMKKDAYLMDTWHESTRPSSLTAENELPVKWVELKVVNSSKPSEIDTSGTVEFIARYKKNGKAEQMHEVSEFVKQEGTWYYLKGRTG